MSTIRVDNFGPSSGGTTYSASGVVKVWINFNGTGTVSIQDSLNVSSITDRSSGKYAVNFNNSFSNANHSSSGNAKKDNTGDDANIRAQIGGATDYTAVASETRVACGRITEGSANIDSPAVYVQTHGDLA